MSCCQETSAKEVPFILLEMCSKTTAANLDDFFEEYWNRIARVLDPIVVCWDGQELDKQKSIAQHELDQILTHIQRKYSKINRIKKHILHDQCETGIWNKVEGEIKSYISNKNPIETLFKNHYSAADNNPFHFTYIQAVKEGKYG